MLQKLLHKADIVGPWSVGRLGAGASMVYVAMCDELDEGTAIMKVSRHPPIGASQFVTFDGQASDAYLKIAGEAASRLRAVIR